MQRRLMLLFLAIHLVAGAFAALPAKLRTGFRPAYFYSAKLRLASNWDMFVEPRRGKVVQVLLLDHEGRRRVAASSNSSRLDLTARVIDARQRKLLSNLTKVEERDSAVQLLRWHCGAHAEGVAARAELWAYDPHQQFELVFADHRARLVARVDCDE